MNIINPRKEVFIMTNDPYGIKKHKEKVIKEAQKEQNIEKFMSDMLVEMKRISSSLIKIEEKLNEPK